MPWIRRGAWRIPAWFVAAVRMWPLLLLAASWQAAFAGEPAATHERVLSNGLRVIVREDHRAPTAVQIVLYRVGSIDETSGRTGLAHLLEHLMFKGTPAHPDGEFSRIVAAMGGRENAFTTHDHTAYYQQIPARGLETVMRLEADRMANLRIEPEEFAREVKVVEEERRLRIEDQPNARVYEQLLAHAFIASPIRTPVTGWMSDLESMRVEDARDWYRHWYGPNNATVIVVGDVDPDSVFAMAERSYGQVASRPTPGRRPQREPEQRGRRSVVVEGQAESPYLALAWQVPKLESIDGPDEPFALAMLAAVLDADDNGRLTRELVRRTRIAAQVGASYDLTGRGPALFVLSGVPAPGVGVEALEQALRAQVERIARDGVDPDELDRIRVQYLASRVYRRDSMFAQAMEIASLESAGLSWRDADRLLERARQITPAQIRSAAQRYFAGGRLTSATLVPVPAGPGRSDPGRPDPSAVREAR